MQAPVQVHATPNTQFHMETDASNYAYRAMLSQKQLDGWHHPIRFMSKSMNPAEQNYRIPNKEALAIVKGLQNWQHWLEQMQLLVHILTNHKNLKSFAKPRTLNCRQMHWLELLTHYNYKIHYRPGDKNCSADALSQQAKLRPPDSKDDQLMILILPKNITELVACEANMTQADWEGLAEVLVAPLTVSDMDILLEAHALTEEWLDKPEGLDWEDGLGQKEGRIWILELDELWRKVLRLYYDSPVTGHLGMSGMLELVARSYWQRNMTDWVTQYI